jgi:hypothetical protein
MFLYTLAQMPERVFIPRFFLFLLALKGFQLLAEVLDFVVHWKSYLGRQ